MAVIFVLTYAGVALGRIPGLRLDRAGFALTGAAMTMAVGALTPREAYQAIDLDTLALLARDDDRRRAPQAVGLLQAGHRLGPGVCAFAADPSWFSPRRLACFRLSWSMTPCV
jgi:hypothetical protein